MYICGLCDRQIQAGTPQCKLTVDRREVVYPEARKVHGGKCTKNRGKKCDCVGHWVDTTGWEIVKEIDVCADCNAGEYK